MAWSPDNRYFFCADTLHNIFLRFDYHPDAGLISNPVSWALERLPGAPDGSCIDHDGCFWNAQFGGSCLVRITPEGKIDSMVRLPVTNPTSCTFGGRRGKTFSSRRHDLRSPRSSFPGTRMKVRCWLLN
jgi:sugar lactone lactonase YvrE